MSQSDAIQWLIDNESTDVDDQEPDSIADVVVSDVQIQADADLTSDQTKQVCSDMQVFARLMLAIQILMNDIF